MSKFTINKVFIVELGKTSPPERHWAGQNEQRQLCKVSGVGQRAYDTLRDIYSAEVTESCMRTWHLCSGLHLLPHSYMFQKSSSSRLGSGVAGLSSTTFLEWENYSSDLVASRHWQIPFPQLHAAEGLCWVGGGSGHYPTPNSCQVGGTWLGKLEKNVVIQFCTVLYCQAPGGLAAKCQVPSSPTS